MLVTTYRDEQTCATCDSTQSRLFFNCIDLKPRNPAPALSPLDVDVVASTLSTAQPQSPAHTHAYASRRQLPQAGLAVALNVALPARAIAPIKATIQRAAIDEPVALIYSHGERAWAVTAAGGFGSVANARGDL